MDERLERIETLLASIDARIAALEKRVEVMRPTVIVNHSHDDSFVDAVSRHTVKQLSDAWDRSTRVSPGPVVIEGAKHRFTLDDLDRVANSAEKGV